MYLSAYFYFSLYFTIKRLIITSFVSSLGKEMHAIKKSGNKEMHVVKSDPFLRKVSILAVGHSNLHRFVVFVKCFFNKR